MLLSGLALFMFVICNPCTSHTLREGQNPRKHLHRHEILEENNYEVKWKIYSDTIKFTVAVRTTGFIGFGLSYTGGMKDADIFIGGVFPNGSHYSSDRYAEGKETPKIDPSQDWILVKAKENNTHTVLQFKRKLDTSDSRDIEITEATTKIIWCYGQTDNIDYHGPENRGILVVNFKDLPDKVVDASKYEVWKMAQPIKLNGKDTLYWCTFYKQPELAKKHHIVGFALYANDTKSAKILHHADVYRCRKPTGANENFFEQYLGKGYDCYYGNSYVPFEHCQSYEIQWALGTKPTMYPDELGIPFGLETHVYYMMEAHFDNPTQEEIEVYAGVQIYYTSKLRDIDIGNLQIAATTRETYALTIPPNSRNFVFGTQCGSECTNRLPKEGITAFMYFLHAHLSARAMKVRLYRKGRELPWIINDEHYDNNYQYLRTFRDKFKIYPGDRLTLECTYETTWKNGLVTVGGISTRDEMCHVMIMYYPRNLEIDQCGSDVPRQDVMKYFGIEKFQTESGQLQLNPTIELPKYLQGVRYSDFIEKIDWTEKQRAEYHQMARFGVHTGYCTSPIRNTTFFNISYPVVDKEYSIPSKSKPNVKPKSL